MSALLRQVIGAREGLLADGCFRHDALDEAGAVAQGQEVNLSARAAIVQPALQRDRLAGVAGDVFDVDASCVSQRALEPFCRARRASELRASAAPDPASSRRYVPS